MLTEFFLQTIKNWLFPPRIYFVVLVLALILVLLGYKKTVKKIAVILFITFWTLSTPLFAQYLMDGLQKPYHPLNITDLNNGAKPDAILVLGNGVDTAIEYPQKDILAPTTLLRLNYAVYLSKATHIPLVLSGGNRASTGLTEAALMKETLDSSISANILEHKSHNTQQQGQCLKNIFLQNNIHTILVVTNAWHMRRSVYAFNKSFAGAKITIIPAPMGFTALKSGSLFVNLLPSLGAFTAAAHALHEYIGITELHLFWEGKLKSPQC